MRKEVKDNTQKAAASDPATVYSVETLDSKTKRKAYMTHLQDLGEALIKLRPDQLAEFDLEDSLADAITEAQRIRSREALRRQKQYIGKVMRRVDVASIESQLAALEDKHSTCSAAFHELETLRDALIADGKTGIGTVIERFPSVDKQKLRQLTKRAQKEVSENTGKTARRALFKFLRETLELHEQQAAESLRDSDDFD